MSTSQTVVAREVFTTSRLAEFCTKRELEKQTGHSAVAWPVYIVKELTDNALDAAEEDGVAPEISIEISTERITVGDNARGLAAETVDRLLDLSSRTSARAHYVSPSRGQQGQALSTIIVMPHALDPLANKAVIIEACGLAHRISVEVNKLSGEPRLVRETSEGSVQTGTRITVEWPESASPLLQEAIDDFVPKLVLGYRFANPHASIRLRTPDGDWTYKAHNPTWKKWRACDPTSPHWYGPERFTRLIAAYIQKDQEAGRRRLLRDFLGLFDGLKRTTRRSEILTALGLNRAALNDLFRDGDMDRVTVARLLLRMKDQAKPVSPQRLGIIGDLHLLCSFWSDEFFQYQRAIGVDASGFPYVIEGAFAYDPDAKGRLLIGAANFASSPSLEFKLGISRNGKEVLANRHAGPNEPVLVFLHIVHPSLTFTDLGKTQLSLNGAVATDLEKVIEKITDVWYKQRRREEKDAKAKLKRQDALERSRKITIKESAYRHMPEAYAAASGGLGARSRQIFYRLRPSVLKDTGKHRLDSQYIEQTLIPDFIAEHPDLCADWTVYYDDRGHLIEPHTAKIIGLGTRKRAGLLPHVGRPACSRLQSVEPGHNYPWSRGAVRRDPILRERRFHRTLSRGPPQGEV